MKLFKFVFFFTISAALTIALNTKIGNIPPLGKFFNPLGGFWVNGEKEAISTPPTITLDGLRQEVSIQFDQYLIPHIFALNDEDLVFAQGYITAFHRLWQMEFQLYSTAGRISELLGESFIDYDKGKRRQGLTYGASRSLEEWKKDSSFYKLLVAYTAGVNAHIKSLKYADYPIEYKLLDYAPETWTEFKCSLLLKEMSDQLSRGEADMENTNALKYFGKQTFDFLFPEFPPAKDLDPVIPIGTPFTFQPLPIDKPADDYVLDYTEPLLSPPNPNNGSNNFAVGATKTGEGSLLANEPDLNLNLPSIWYIAHLNAPGFNTFGATLPGMPGVILGHNDSIAWGMTNAKRDLVDWFKIKFRTPSREEYLYDDKWLKTRKTVEEIKVRNGTTVYDTIVYTHFGPVVYDTNFPAGDETLDLAMRWTAHDPSQEIKAIYYINKAANYEDFKNALRFFTGPPQNFAFASVKGDIAIQIPGMFPIKWKEQGKFLLDGSKSSHDWAKYIPEEHKLGVYNPPRGFISSANQHPVDSTYPYYTYDYNFEHYRGRRINDRLNILNTVKVEDMIRLQNDNFNFRAYESLPMMLDSLDTTRFDPQKQEIYNLMKSWSYFNTPESKAATIYEIWWDHLYEMLWDEFDSAPYELNKPHVYHSIHILKNYPLHDFIDIKATGHIETAFDLYNISFQETIVSLNKWITDNSEDYAWYRFKNTRILHLMRIPQFSIDQIQVGGNWNIVNAAADRHGPSWRMVVQLKEDNVSAWGVYPGSQTGNPGNPMYGHMIDDWAKGNYYQMLFPSEPTDNEESVKHDIKLLPN